MGGRGTGVGGFMVMVWQLSDGDVKKRETCTALDFGCVEYDLSVTAHWILPGKRRLYGSNSVGKIWMRYRNLSIISREIICIDLDWR